MQKCIIISPIINACEIFLLLLWKIRKFMASQLHDTLARIVSKTSILMEKYQALEARNHELSEKLSMMESDNEILRREVEKLQHDVSYLRMSHTIASTPEQVRSSQAIISRIVRDIDQCIAQLNT